MSAHVLVIDDEPDVRRMLGLYLAGRGHRVTTADGGRSGAATFEQVAPDLVLCDLRMPDVDGLELLSEFTARRPDMPVIIVSGTGDMGDAVQALRRGAWDYVTKPILDFGVLDHAIDRSLERARLLDENRAYRERLEHSLRQLEDDQAAGQQIQFTLLPARASRFGRYECSRYLKPSGYLSGDFIDYFTIDDHRFACYMADVAGHGVSSAVVTVMLKSYVGRYLETFRHYGDPTVTDPAALMAALNRDLLGGSHGKYLTMFYAVIDQADARICFANGGQFPFPFCFDGTGVRQIGGKSPPLGLYDDADFENQSIDASGRFAVTVFSDGVPDAVGAPSAVAARRRLGALASGDALDAPQMAARLGLDDLAGAPDDASILVLRGLPHA